ncbi:organic hydroperoxide resistance protein [Pseudomonas sp. R3.Fl]|uniref:organic hydroperoxide resistance protein n=1 Tax=Pseudomonas TaxID=286 RepID=UPI00201D6D51|nr:organic hydroperoxide resistance protein [Pseudomonas sp. R3.Fl]MCL6692358.1 organic hydroperoxide resistance protein [Pseudomonas sp. R3.Fl]
MSVLYTAKATAIGGRNGTVRSDDGLLDLQLALPAGLGGKGGATNPEQLFAAGYAACFGNAIIHSTRNQEVKIRDNDVEVVAAVGIGPNAAGGFGLTVALEVTLVGIEQAKAEVIVAEAHKVCPYSNATRGNVDVVLTVHTR